MTKEEIAYLKSSDGQKLYQEYQDFSDQQLEVLIIKKHQEIPYFKSLVSLIKLRRLAGDKFSKSQEMFFESLGLEQATNEKISKYLASRFKKDWTVFDLGCGLGSNAIFIAGQVKQVTAVDLSAEKIACAQENAVLYGVDEKIDFVVGDLFGHITKADAFFIDPARDLDNGTKTRSILNSQPALLELLPKLLEITKNIAVKISPAFDYEELKLLPLEPEVEVISDSNNCKVAMLWFGDFKTAKRRATCFKNDKQYTLVDGVFDSIPPVSKIKKYLYEPNKAISKAHLVDEVAQEFSLTKIDFKLAYLTADALLPVVDGAIFRHFEVIETGEFSVKKLQKRLKELEIVKTELVVKGLHIKGEELRQRLKLQEGREFLVILASVRDKKTFILVKNILF